MLWKRLKTMPGSLRQCWRTICHLVQDGPLRRIRVHDLVVQRNHHPRHVSVIGAARILDRADLPVLRAFTNPLVRPDRQCQRIRRLSRVFCARHNRLNDRPLSRGESVAHSHRGSDIQAPHERPQTRKTVSFPCRLTESHSPFHKSFQR